MTLSTHPHQQAHNYCDSSFGGSDSFAHTHRQTQTHLHIIKNENQSLRQTDERQVQKLSPHRSGGAGLKPCPPCLPTGRGPQSQLGDCVLALIRLPEVRNSVCLFHRTGSLLRVRRKLPFLDWAAFLLRGLAEARKPQSSTCLFFSFWADQRFSM